MARMQEEVKRDVLEEMRTVEDLAGLAGRSPAEMHSDLERWKAEGRIFSVEHEGIEFFPAFALDPASRYLPYPVVAEIIRILNQIDGSRWALASWFIAVNSYLDVQRPQDLLVSDPEWVIEAAEDEVVSVKFPHG